MIGMRESEASALVYQALTAAGLRNAGVLALFGGESLAVVHFFLPILPTLSPQRTQHFHMVVVQIVC